MGWPFLWPADEPWPVCHQRDPEMAAFFEGALDRAEREGMDLDDSSLGLPTRRQTIARILEQARDGHNVPYLPVLQLKRSEFPAFPFPDGSDLFQLLWCPMVHFEGGGGFLIFWRQQELVIELRTDAPPTDPNGDSITLCSLDPEQISDYPHRFEIDPPTMESVDDDSWDNDEAFEAMEDLGPAPGTKLFGFPKWVQGPDYPSCSRCERQMNLLITISSVEFGHGADNGARWTPYEDREVLRDAPFALQQQYASPHNWMIGDTGDAYLFQCRKCGGQFASRVQCS
jgi:hypothetical protein